MKTFFLKLQCALIALLVTTSLNAEESLIIIKPNAINKNVLGDVISHFEKKGLSIKAIKKMTLTKRQAQAFYQEHAHRPFYNDLVSFMTSGPVIPFVISGNNAVSKGRAIIGATNPEDAAEGTLRNLYGDSLDANSFHGSDSIESAQREVAFMFSETELLD